MSPPRRPWPRRRRALLGRLIARAEARNLRQMVAIIGDSANHASIGLHAALGFERTGCFARSDGTWPLGDSV